MSKIANYPKTKLVCRRWT